MKRKPLLLIGLTTVTVLAGVIYFTSLKGQDSTYQNPVFEPVLADPSIIEGEDGYFYAYGTEDAWGKILIQN
ncbi:hypothetical protein [Halobacillus andaensis]|uniref:hypothetical protein n=1 Tax=Halobacillus andaensis TaxID=1176239 RepID=UPI003D751177